MPNGTDSSVNYLYIPSAEFLTPAAERIAETYNLTLIREKPAVSALVLVYDQDGLSLRSFSSETGAVRVDFVSGRSGYRLSTMTGTAQPLLRAIGFKRNRGECRVLDATAGLGVDGMSMALAGCMVCLVEKSAVMAALLADGLQRAAENEEAEEVARVVSERVVLEYTDSIEVMSDISENQFDVIYLDPMFPQRQKSSRVKKEMELAKYFALPGENALELLEAALSSPVRRVVLKRPLKAPVLRNGFSSQVKGKSIRFDIYVR